METMRLKDAMNYVLSKTTQSTVAKVLGITTNQVYKYASGYTTTCNTRVTDAIYDNFGLVLDKYDSEEEYLKYRKMSEE